MTLQQTRATPAAEIKGDQAELNQQNILTSGICPKKPEPHHRTEQWNIKNLEKKCSANLYPKSIPLLITEVHHPH